MLLGETVLRVLNFDLSWLAIPHAMLLMQGTELQPPVSYVITRDTSRYTENRSASIPPF